MPQEEYRPRPVPPNVGGTRTVHGLPVSGYRTRPIQERRPSDPLPRFMTEGNPLQAPPPPPETNIPLEPNYKQIPPSAYEGPFGLPQPPPYQGPMPPTNNPPARRSPQVMGLPGPVTGAAALRRLMDRASTIQRDPRISPPSQQPTNPFAPEAGGR